MEKFKTDCIFFEYFRDHSACVPLCSFNKNRDLLVDIERLSKECPCVYYVTKDMLRDCLLVDGFHP